MKQTSDRFGEGFDRILKVVHQLDAQQAWMRPSSESNSVGIVLQHLIGNLNQWVIAGVGGAQFQRNRPEEFRDYNHPSKDEIVRRFANLRSAAN